MDHRVVLVFSIICIQGLLALDQAPDTSSENGAAKKTLTEGEKTWLEKEMRNIKEKSETFKNSMRPYSMILPGLGEMVESFVKTGQQQAKDFADFNKERISGKINEQDAATQYRKFFDGLKNLEQSFQSKMRETFGHEAVDAVVKQVENAPKFNSTEPFSPEQ